ncbi:MAG: hypothetical protein KDB27_34375, partial [Planctomycetales bacterium]|nr:hypothetical protein [Planctomycetales bacterium]
TAKNRDRHADGTERFPERRVTSPNLAACGLTGAPAIAMNDAGDFTVTWDQLIGFCDTAESDSVIVARMYYEHGTARSSVFRVSSPHTRPWGDPALPKIAMDPDGYFTIVWWEEMRAEAFDEQHHTELLVQGFDTDGGRQFADVVARASTDWCCPSIPSPEIMAVAGNMTVLVWYDRNDNLVGQVIRPGLGREYVPGDANRNGVFDSGDLVSVFQTGKYETGEPASWEDGDWNGDGVFSSADFVSAFVAGAYKPS